ncbi:glucose-methanol-choline oxidoreductase [Amylocarpus encephaloides]|uniref:Glucose-methanol-choline oxidoreductase n=1 Tax=Amylocarpus encephaloides TaxID=45428 RepID=A0A9P7YLN4_9HELO|nr:glucose-methanol-choline oxidoreductase [Amylocarpus encephaloides]
MLTTLLRPTSRGSDHLATSVPQDRPKVDFGTLSDPEDYIFERKTVRLPLEIAEGMKVTGYAMWHNMTFPEEDMKQDKEDGNDEQMDKYIRERARTTFHYCSTCRMAPEDDKQLLRAIDDKSKVYGWRT